MLFRILSLLCLGKSKVECHKIVCEVALYCCNAAILFCQQVCAALFSSVCVCATTLDLCVSQLVCERALVWSATVCIRLCCWNELERDFFEGTVAILVQKKNLSLFQLQFLTFVFVRENYLGNIGGFGFCECASIPYLYIVNQKLLGKHQAANIPQTSEKYSKTDITQREDLSLFCIILYFDWSLQLFWRLKFDSLIHCKKLEIYIFGYWQLAFNKIKQVFL